MRKLSLTIALAVGIGLAVTSVALADHGIHGPKTLKLIDVSDKFEFVDVGAPAQSEGDFGPGDMLLFDNILRNRTDTNDVGRFVSACTMGASPGIALCRGTLLLEKGTIELSTTVDFANADTIVTAVTGGTGQYRNVHGVAILAEEVREGARKLTVFLQP